MEVGSFHGVFWPALLYHVGELLGALVVVQVVQGWAEVRPLTVLYFPVDLYKDKEENGKVIPASWQHAGQYSSDEVVLPCWVGVQEHLLNWSNNLWSRRDKTLHFFCCGKENISFQLCESKNLTTNRQFNKEHVFGKMQGCHGSETLLQRQNGSCAGRLRETLFRTEQKCLLQSTAWKQNVCTLHIVEQSFSFSVVLNLSLANSSKQSAVFYCNRLNQQCLKWNSAATVLQLQRNPKSEILSAN